MEWAGGGCLTTRVADRFPTSKPGSLIMGEDEARFYFTQFVAAIDYCHTHNIAHRYCVLNNITASFIRVQNTLDIACCGPLLWHIM